MEFVRDVVQRLEATGVTYAITGSIASNAWGTPRLKHDLDIVVWLDLNRVDDSGGEGPEGDLIHGGASHFLDSSMSR